MNELKVFSHNEFGGVRGLLINSEPWLVGKDVAEVLGYEAGRNAIKHHVDDEDKLTHQISASGQNRNMIIINESGLYSLILSSKLPKAKAFRRWVTSEVLPSLRKSGSYIIDNEMNYIAGIVTETMTRLIPEIVSQTLKHVFETVPIKGGRTTNPSSADKIHYPRQNAMPVKLKLSTFPVEIVNQVNVMLGLMLEQQSLNFKQIERFCCAHGYTISSVAVKKYYDRHFLNNQTGEN